MKSNAESNAKLSPRTDLQEQCRVVRTGARGGKLECAAERLHFSIRRFAHAVDIVHFSGSDVLQRPLHSHRPPIPYADVTILLCTALVFFNDSRFQNSVILYRYQSQ